MQIYGYTHFSCLHFNQRLLPGHACIIPVQGSPSGLTVDAVMRSLRLNEIDLMLCKVRRNVLDKMEAQFAKHYDEKSENR